MNSHNGRVDHLHGRVMSRSERVHDPAPDASLRSDCSRSYMDRSCLAVEAGDKFHLDRAPLSPYLDIVAQANDTLVLSSIIALTAMVAAAPVTATLRGSDCFFADDQTVSADNTGRSAAGPVFDLDGNFVLVEVG